MNYLRYLAIVTSTDVRIAGHCIVQIYVTLFNRQNLQAAANPAESTGAAVPVVSSNAASATPATIPHYQVALVLVMFFVIVILIIVIIVRT